ncbi:family 1 glycosylhydrolase [Microbacterium sp. P04]|uniref:family 1 glycosylhydrolase n=1 Tax=Microbacterium sp. P04 TaxID=3366947 RepID=UPI0037469DBA
MSAREAPAPDRMGIGLDRLPAEFLWGVSVGAHQTEGGNLGSDWWYRENQANSGIDERCGDAVDSYHRYDEDLTLARSAGFADYRFGIEWSRIEPADGFISRAEIDHYVGVVQSARSLGLRPMLTLNHFTLPLWFAAQGGWLSDRAEERFLRYIDAVAPVIAAGASSVMTINEPNVYAVLDRLNEAPGGLAGGLPEPDPRMTAALIHVHRAAVARLRANHPGLSVGWGVSTQDYRAAPGAEEQADRYAEPRDQVFLRASTGDDFVGVQTYTGGIVGIDGKPIINPAARRTLNGWEFLPDSLGGAIRRVSRVVPDVPIIVTENGVAVSDDAARIEYTAEALTSMVGAIDDGADVRGYFHWSLLDNWEWGHWEPTFGLVAVDRRTFERSPKPSLAWLGALAAPGVTSRG